MKSTISIIRFQKIFDQQIEEKKIRVKKILFHKIRRIIRSNDLIQMSMKSIHDSYVTSVNDLSLENEEKNSSIFSVSEKNMIFFFLTK